MENLKILAIDDSPDNLTVLKAVTADAFPGATVLTALNGRQGITLARSEDPDVILLDIIMPGVDGFEVCRKLKAEEHLRLIPVVFLTALKADPESRIKALEAGAEAFLTKPFDVQELTAQILAMAKLKRSSQLQLTEKERLAALVKERTRELQRELSEHQKSEELLQQSNQKLEQNQIAMLNLLDDLKNENEARQKSENQFRSIFNDAPMGIALIDSLAGHYLEMNQIFTEIVGRSREELLRINWMQITHPDDIQQDLDNMEKMNARKIAGFKKHKRYIRPDGSVVWIAMAVAPMPTPDTAHPRHLCMISDITERIQAEAQLRLQSGALEAAANAIVITDNKGVIQWANAAFTAFTGYSLEEAIGKTPNLLKSGKHDQAFYQKLWNTILAGEVWHGELINRRKDGSFYTEDMTITPMKDNSGAVTHFIGVKQDITARKQFEEKLMQTERLDSIGRLTSGVAHDLNNIITPIILSAEMLRTTEQPETRECLLSSIEECAQRGAAVVNQILTFARGNKGERKQLQLANNVVEMENFLQQTFPKNLTITSSIPDDIWPVMSDHTQIHQVLLNLCINARDAMSEGGTLHLSVENAEIDAAFSSMAPDAKPGDYAMLSIADTGTGIPREIISKIFDPFFTTKEVGKGTGLGLSTVIGIVRSHDGFVIVDSREGLGTTFKVFLPRDTAGTPRQRVLPSTEEMQGAGATILLVDDETLITKAIAMVLENKGYKVLTAANGNEALALYGKHAKEIAVVLTDMMMPGMDGVALSRTLKEINPRIKILVSTGHASESTQTELHALGVDGILRKPYDARKLVATLHDTIHTESA